MAKAFSIEDGNLSNKPITTVVSKTYSDIDCSFKRKPSRDIYKKTDADAVRQSVKNLLLTRRGEKPFNPYFGSAISNLLFSLSTEVDEGTIDDYVRNAINNNEPRAKVLEVNTIFSPDYNSAEVTVIFQVVTTMENVSVTVSISRNR